MMCARDTRVLVMAALFLLCGGRQTSADFPDGWTRDAANPVLGDGGAGAWDSTMAYGTTVLFHEGIYKMWYEGDGGIGYATSPDGWTWTKWESNPVLVPGPGWYDACEVASASVVVVDGVYHMWYSGLDEQPGEAHDSRIAHATSPDGIAWTKDPANPVMDLGEPGSWDENELIHPTVCYESGLYRMWYNGCNEFTTQCILYAESFDGVEWERHPEIVLATGPPGAWDDELLAMMGVLPVCGTYYMFYTGINQSEQIQIGYATSFDGVRWLKPAPSEPILGPGEPGAWDGEMVVGPVVLLVNDTTAVMWYGGSDGESFRTGMATATLHPARVPTRERQQVLRCRLGPSSPNPFRQAARIQFELLEAADVVVEVRDVEGRHIRQLLQRHELIPGSYGIEWNGCDDANRPVAAGMYLYRVIVDGRSGTGRMVHMD